MSLLSISSLAAGNCHVETVQQIFPDFKMVKFSSPRREQYIVFHDHGSWEDHWELEHFANNFDRKTYRPALPYFKAVGQEYERASLTLGRRLSMTAVMEQHNSTPFGYAFTEQPLEEVNSSVEDWGRLHQALDWLPRHFAEITESDLLNSYLALSTEGAYLLARTTKPHPDYEYFGRLSSLPIYPSESKADMDQGRKLGRKYYDSIKPFFDYASRDGASYREMVASLTIRNATSGTKELELRENPELIPGYAARMLSELRATNNPNFDELARNHLELFEQHMMNLVDRDRFLVRQMIYAFPEGRGIGFRGAHHEPIVTKLFLKECTKAVSPTVDQNSRSVGP